MYSPSHPVSSSPSSTLRHLVTFLESPITHLEQAMIHHGLFSLVHSVPSPPIIPYSRHPYSTIHFTPMGNLCPGPFISDSISPTLTSFSWLRNVNKLSNLIDQLSDLAATAPQEQQRQLNIQITALRKDFKKQKERYIAFLRLTKEYADRFLSDISEEIKQQSSFLEALEKRLHLAKYLREKVVDLRKSYELGTLKSIKKVRHVVLSEPLPEDVDLFREMDMVLNEIRRCYIEMDKFWIDEVCRVTKALKDRLVGPEDIERWITFRQNLGETIARWETRPTDDVVALRPSTWPSVRLFDPRHVGSRLIEPEQVYDLGSIASSLSEYAKAARRTLESVWLSPSAEVYLKPDFRSIILRARVKFSENRHSFLEFLRESLRYEKSVAMTRQAFLYSPFSLSRTSQDLVDDAARLGTEAMVVSAETAVQTQVIPTFSSIYEKSVSSLHEMDHELSALSSCISAWVTELDGHSTFPAFNLKELQRLSGIWVKNRDVIQLTLAALLLPDESDGDETSS